MIVIKSYLKESPLCPLERLSFQKCFCDTRALMKRWLQRHWNSNCYPNSAPAATGEIASVPIPTGSNCCCLDFPRALKVVLQLLVLLGHRCYAWDLWPLCIGSFQMLDFVFIEYLHPVVISIREDLLACFHAPSSQVDLGGGFP